MNSILTSMYQFPSSLLRSTSLRAQEFSGQKQTAMVILRTLLWIMGRRGAAMLWG